MYSIHIEAITQPTAEMLQKAAALMQLIPEFDSAASAATMHARIASTKALLQLCFVEGELAGFKLGYELAEGEFYSWLGGVVPDFRRLGLAEAMLKAQESWALEQGYQQVKVKTRNRFPAMLAMLVQNHYQVAAVTSEGMPLADHRISLQKSLA